MAMGSAVIGHGISRCSEERYPTWRKRDPLGEKETALGESLTRLFLQVGLALYLGDMLMTMEGASKKLEADLAIAGHPNVFPSTPKATTTEWDLLQTFHYRTLLCTQVLKGNAAVWQSAVADITAEVSDVGGLLKNLSVVKHTVTPADAITGLHEDCDCAGREP